MLSGGTDPGPGMAPRRFGEYLLGDELVLQTPWEKGGVMTGRSGTLVAACWVLMSSVCAAAPRSDQMINLGSHRLQIRLLGEKAPTVVIDAGIADRLDRWQPVQERIARVTRVITYNRAGYGESEPGPLPRDCGREAAELRVLLDAASVPGPFLLVGHSLGALNVQVFAARHPEKVVGMVLLDPPPLSFIRKEEYTSLLALAEQMTGGWQASADAGAGSSDPQERRLAAFLRMIASEHRELFGESAKLVSEIASFGQTPLLVIAAGQPNPAFGDVAEDYQRYWIEQSRILSRKSEKGRFVLAKESSHLLHADVPDLVVESIVSMVEQARGQE